MPVHELVYKRMAERPQGKPRNQAWAISSYGFRLAYRSKLAWMITVPSFFPAAIIIFIMYLSQEMADGVGNNLARQLAQITSTDNDGWTVGAAPAIRFLLDLQLWFVTFLAAFKGAPIVSEDVSKHALDMYLSRPISPLTYALGKLLTIMRGLFIVEVLPLTLVIVSAWALLPGCFQHAKPLGLYTLLAALWVVFAFAALAVGVSSIGKSARFAVIAWFTLTFFTFLAGNVLSLATDTPEFAYISFRHDVLTVAAWIIGLPNSVPDGAEDPFAAMAALCVYFGLAGFALYRRLRRGILA